VNECKPLAGGGAHEQLRGVVQIPRAGGPAEGVGGPQQEAEGLHAGVGREDAVEVRGVRSHVGRPHFQPHE